MKRLVRPLLPTMFVAFSCMMSLGIISAQTTQQTDPPVLKNTTPKTVGKGDGAKPDTTEAKSAQPRTPKLHTVVLFADDYDGKTFTYQVWVSPEKISVSPFSPLFPKLCFLQLHVGPNTSYPIMGNTNINEHKLIFVLTREQAKTLSEELPGNGAVCSVEFTVYKGRTKDIGSKKDGDPKKLYLDSLKDKKGDEAKKGEQPKEGEQGAAELPEDIAFIATRKSPMSGSPVAKILSIKKLPFP